MKLRIFIFSAKLLEYIRSAEDARAITNRIKQCAERIKTFPNKIVLDDLRPHLVYYSRRNALTARNMERGERSRTTRHFRRCGIRRPATRTHFSAPSLLVNGFKDTKSGLIDQPTNVHYSSDLSKMLRKAMRTQKVTTVYTEVGD